MKIGSSSPLLSKRDRRAETLNHALYAMKIDTWLKARIAADLPELISGKKSLIEYPQLSDVHISTLAHLLKLTVDY